MHGRMPLAALMHDIGQGALTWLPIVFFAILVLLIWRTIQLMPRVKPNLTEPNSEASVKFTDVAGVEEAKAELQEVVDFLREPKQFAKLGARVPKGLLLYGPPGTGKTLLAKAVAHESGASFYSQSASAFVEMFAGLGASRIRKLFDDGAQERARRSSSSTSSTPSARPARGHGFNREQDQTLNQLLVELDGFATADQVVVMGASNRIQDLDPALLRPGRFDRQLLVAPPDLAGREKILEVHTRGKPLGRRRRPQRRRAADGRPRRRRPREHLQRGGDLRRPPRTWTASARPSSRRRWSASSPASSSAASSARRRSGSSPTTRPATR